MPQPLDPNWHAIDRSERHIVSFGWFGGSVKLCQVQFHRTGIFVHFPYHPDVDGMLSRIDVSPGEEPQQHSFEPQGAVTSHKVKYSHHLDGRAHFSQDGKVRTEVRGSAASLTTDADHIFSIDVQDLSTFQSFESEDYYKGEYGRAYFEFQGLEPEAIHIVAYWKLLTEGADVRMARNPVRLRTPVGAKDMLGIAPPPGSPLERGLLFLDATTRRKLTEEKGFVLLFTGGFAENLDDPEFESSFLALQYPAGPSDRMPSIDLAR